MFSFFFVYNSKKFCMFVFNMECTTGEYIQSQESLDAKIVAIEALIDAMLLNAIDVIGDSGTMSYSMDDGQMKVMTEFRSTKEVMKGVEYLEKMLHMYINRRDGNLIALRGKLNY